MLHIFKLTRQSSRVDIILKTVAGKERDKFVPNIVRNKHFSASVEAQESEISQNVRHVSEIPSFKELPIVGCLFSLITRKDFYAKDKIIFWKTVINENGPVFKFSIPGFPPTVVITLPDDIEAMYRATMTNPIRKTFHSLKKVRDDTTDNYFEMKAGILVENDEEWKRVRSKVQTPMMKPKNLHRYIAQMDGVTLDFMERIKSFQTEFGEMPSNFLKEIYKWALESLSLIALNRRLGCLEPDLPSDSIQLQLIKTANEIFENLSKTEIMFPWWRIFPSSAFNKLEACHEIFLRIVDQIIRETEAELKAKLSQNFDWQNELSLLEILLQQEGLTRKDVVTFILDMLFAGIDTTSHTLAFTLYLLARNPEVQRTLQKEVDSVLGNDRQLMNESQLAKLSYLKCCVKESLRVFPLVRGSYRTLNEDTVIGGYMIPKGHQIFAMNGITSGYESLFPRAKVFIPERWGKDKPLGPIHPFAALPFSHGPRMCIGRRVAEQELYIFLARVMQRYNVNYKYKDFEKITRFVALPSEPLRFEFTERI